MILTTAAGAAFGIARAAQAGGTQVGEGGAAGAYERSVELVRRVLAQRPGDARIVNVLAEVHFRRGKFKDALSAYGEAIRLEPQLLDAVLGTAESYMQLEDYDHALEHYRKLLVSGGPKLTALARRGIAGAHFQCGRYSEAVAELRTAIQDGDDGAEQRFLLGRALEAQARGLHASSSSPSEASKMDVEAAAALEQSLQMDPGLAQAHYLLGTLHRRQGRNDLALHDMESFRRVRQSVAAVDPAAAMKAEQLFESRTAVQLARTLFTGGDATSAQGMLAHALEILPGFNEALSYQAWILSRTGRVADAARMYETVLAAEPDHAEALWNLGKIKLAAGQAQEAAPLLLRATEVRRSFPEGWELLTVLAEEQGIYSERAEEFARNALKARSSAANQARLAFALLSAGKALECRQVVQEGLKRFPGDADLLQVEQAMREAASPRK